MSIQLMDNERGFEVKNGAGEQVGQIVWQLDDNVMIMNGTYVDDSLRGQNMGEQLLDAAAKYAREHDYKMKAVCPYVVKKFNTSDKYSDLEV
ncbi:MAG: GNAT family N-acetyltransferase [Caryophanon sp.]|nr:GNAT family N-acetyltransferase [Caryophanon sp.]